MTEIGDVTGAWVVYDYDHGPYAIAMYANAEAAARHAARQGYGRVGFWPFGTEFREAIDTWEGRLPPTALGDPDAQAAYERGWRDACDDHLDMRVDPDHPIGERHQQPYDPELPKIPRKSAMPGPLLPDPVVPST